MKLALDIDGKRAKIEELLKYIEERLAELEEEKEELRQFHELDRSRRSMEFTIYQRELNEASEELHRLEEVHHEEMDASAQLRRTVEDHERMIADLEKELQQSQQTLELHRTERAQLMQEKESHVKLRAELEMTIKDAEGATSTGESERKRLTAELNQLQKQLGEKQQTLDDLQSEFEQATEQEAALRSNVELVRQEKRMLEEKRARLSRFASKKERQKFLDQEIAKLKKARDLQLNEMKSVKAEIAALEKEMTQNEKSLQTMQATMDGFSQETLAAQAKANKPRLNELNQQRKDLWRKEAQEDAVLGNLKEEYRRLNRALNSSVNQVRILHMQFNQ